MSSEIDVLEFRYQLFDSLYSALSILSWFFFWFKMHFYFSPQKFLMQNKYSIKVINNLILFWDILFAANLEIRKRRTCFNILLCLKEIEDNKLNISHYVTVRGKPFWLYSEVIWKGAKFWGEFSLLARLVIVICESRHIYSRN